MARKARIVFMAALMAVVFAGLPQVSEGQLTATKIPQPTKGWNKPVMVHGDEAHRETSLALSPTDPNLMIICAPSGVPNTQYNQSYFHISNDGGKSWKPERVEGDGGDARNYTFEGGDCDVAFDEGGTMYSADTWLGNLSVGHSTDRGETWSGTPIAATGMVVDRPWLVGGPKGTIHVTYEDLQCCMPATIWYTRSDDFGETFRPTTPVAQASPDGGFTWEGNLVVAPGGEDLYLPYTRRAGPALGSLDNQGAETLWVAVSHDSGLTWNSKLVASMPNPMSYLYPSMAMDGKGNLHVVFSSRTDVDRPIWYSFSSDKGEKWTKPIPILRKVSGYSPWIAANESGDAAVVWYGSDDPKANDIDKFDWYFYWAKIRGAASGHPKISGGPTTKAPLYTGQSDIPEFENVRLDENGKMHIGASAFWKNQAQQTRWAIYYQSER